MTKRLKALEARYSPKERLCIVGGLPTGREMIQSMAQRATSAPKPLCPSLDDSAEAPREPAMDRPKDKVSP